MKLIYHFSLIVLMLTFSCVERYEFPITDDGRTGLVVEGFVSDLSYSDIQSMPLDQRYFTITLRESNAISSQSIKPVTGAHVELVSDANEFWDYAESGDGIYTLYYDDLKIDPNKKYKVSITLSDGNSFESSFESAPAVSPVGKTAMIETFETVYETQGGETVITTEEAIQINLDLPVVQPATETLYAKWDFLTTFGVRARFVDSPNDIRYKCWATSIYENPGFLMYQGKGGGVSKMFTVLLTNEELHDGYSTLIRQQSMNKEGFLYWSDIQKQTEQADLFAPPPYNLISNITAVNSDTPVFGYFGVVREQYYRWNFMKSDLSKPFPYPEALTRSCELAFEPSRVCFDCREFSGLGITNNPNQPWWWSAN
ncbi:DUF4249 domain-containing protein [Reichenbachiella carrageenanivorans]|uniref:DUF4249 domain-containing protein n=1 Tax=Reichenbachiella carrageenanivorans TaxID=2979869 RepID=A0ABY6CVJ8_9BACT|nr:DUF4249 domain-containing protein [Reichenbachiella carrageenanivorans]UXX77931.1 DUF4249 domain-containing protein [Reichenbachiella carrageenanivorans]